MASASWPTKSISVATLQLDEKNPRLGREVRARAPRDIIQHLFEHDKAMDVAQSIALRGYFPNEPLLTVKEKDKYVVVEGNRRLAALKALREPGLLEEGPLEKQVARLSRSIQDLESIAKVPVTIAPSRRATDRQIAGRHIGSPVLAWQAENRASFILDKLAEGYDNTDLRDQLGFTLSDIQNARQTRAIADMARSLDLPPEVRAKLDHPRAKIFTTLERVFESGEGRKFLMVEPSADHGLRGTTTQKEFVKGFSRLVTDIALGKQSSRTLNTNENIRSYFQSWKPADRPASKRGTFVPSDVIKGKSVASSSPKPAQGAPPKKQKPLSETVLPRDFKVRCKNDRLIDIRSELIKLKRKDYPNAGAVLLRVFLELAIVDYLGRTGDLKKLTEMLKKRNALQHGSPTMKHLTREVVRIAKAKLSVADARKVEKALTYDSSAPFSVSELHTFVHQTDMPSERDIQQFWLRTEPLFRLMLEQEPEGSDD